MPVVFWNLTPWEFLCALKAYKNTMETQKRTLAWMQANIMNCWVKKGHKISINQLLGGKKFVLGENIKDHYRAKKAKKEGT